MDYSIETIDISSLRNRPWKYIAFTKLEVGQGFRVPLSDLSYASGTPSHTVQVSAWYWGKKLGRRFATRRERDCVLVVRVE